MGSRSVGPFGFLGRKLYYLFSGENFNIMRHNPNKNRAIFSGDAP